MVSFVDKATVKLQGIPGHKKGTPAGELKPGDVVMWSFGYTNVVRSVVPVGSNFVDVFFDNYDKARRMGRKRLVVLKGESNV